MSFLNKLLSAIDVVRRSGQSRVGHDMYGQRGDVGRPDHPSDGTSRAELIAASFEPVTKERRRQRGVDEAGRDEIDADGRELEREARGEGGHRRGGRRYEREPRACAAPAGAAYEQQRASRPDFRGGVARHPECEQQVFAQGETCLFELNLLQGPLARARPGEHDVVDRCWQIAEE